MAVTDSIKNAVGLGHGHPDPSGPYRDSCAHLLIPLNQCRYREMYLPWKCENERHSYEKCQYEEFKKRVAKMDEIRAAKGGARSN
ncbi:hypothetical protein H2199_006806 [Coniosporium tulheliwenetii]|uniref:Uncharacterized protein n=1 Tax=Coniosporium tulheliwenetii TaxID=3383036 RepID=A0ACC2YUE2_9PEZI|nr:hypothetical protein H2199_006806 [Cladosporium sp. JES 115]